MDNYYDILEVEESASHGEIKRAYRQLIQVWHPDRFQGNHELKAKAEYKTKQITEAFRNLADPILRRQHDLDLSRKQPSRQTKPYQNKPTRQSSPSTKIIACPNSKCGFQLRVPTKSRLKVHCVNPACRTIFMYDPVLDAMWNVFTPTSDEESGSSASKAKQSASYSDKDAAQKLGVFLERMFQKAIKPLVAIVLILLWLGILYVASRSDKESRSHQVNPPSNSTKALTPEPLPPNGLAARFHTGKPIAPLKIITRSTDANYFVKLVDWTSGKTVLTLFVRAGQMTETKVPLGSYKLRYAAGTQWYGTEQLFGPATSYHEADKRLDFVKEESAYSGYTVELFLRPHGNLHMRSVTRNEW